MTTTSKYSVFRPHLEHHTNLGDQMEEILGKNSEDEMVTKELAEKLSEKNEMEMTFIRSIISEGKDWFTSHNDLVVEQRAEGSGGNKTFFWSSGNQ